MRYKVRLGNGPAEEIAARWGPERSAEGAPSEFDFWSGPLAAAHLAFSEFDALTSDLVPEIRSFHLFDDVFGPVLFTGMLVGDEVKIVSIVDDPDYWDTIGNDPDE